MFTVAECTVRLQLSVFQSVFNNIDNKPIMLEVDKIKIYDKKTKLHPKNVWI